MYDVQIVLDRIADKLKNKDFLWSYVYSNYLRPCENNLALFDKERGYLLTFAFLSEEDEEILIRDCSSHNIKNLMSGDNFWLLSVVNFSDNPIELREILKPVLNITNHINYIRTRDKIIQWKSPTYKKPHPNRKTITLHRWMRQ